MKLIEKGDQITLFKDGIIVDKKLLKYRLLDLDVDIREKIISENIINNNVQLNFLDQGSERKKKEDIIKTLSRVKDFINSEDAKKFNISISERLVEKLRKSDAIINNRLTVLASTSNNNNLPTNDSFFNKLTEYIDTGLKKVLSRKTYDINVIELFDQVKILAGKEVEFRERSEAYLNLIHKAIALNQDAQLDKLISELVIHIYESVLSVSGFNRYILMSDLISLQNKCERQLDIDYIKNFVRVIPDSVAERKILADNLCVFDNYVVLYYDPSGSSYSLTKHEEEEVERIKKDPILFGVIQGSGKLYYIDSWIDELCDLTWDQVVEKLGEEKKL